MGDGGPRLLAAAKFFWISDVFVSELTLRLIFDTAAVRKLNQSCSPAITSVSFNLSGNGSSGMGRS
jgi:hypothetical protein